MYNCLAKLDNWKQGHKFGSARGRPDSHLPGPSNGAAGAIGQQQNLMPQCWEQEFPGTQHPDMPEVLKRQSAASHLRGTETAQGTPQQHQQVPLSLKTTTLRSLDLPLTP